MRIIHSGGFPEDERRQTRAVIYSNLVIAFKVLLDIMRAESIDFQQERTKVSSPIAVGCGKRLRHLCTDADHILLMS